MYITSSTIHPTLKFANWNFIEHRSPNRPRVLGLYQFGYAENDELIHFVLSWGPWVSLTRYFDSQNVHNLVSTLAPKNDLLFIGCSKNKTFCLCERFFFKIMKVLNTFWYISFLSKVKNTSLIFRHLRSIMYAKFLGTIFQWSFVGVGVDTDFSVYLQDELKYLVDIQTRTQNDKEKFRTQSRQNLTK